MHKTTIHISIAANLRVTYAHEFDSAQHINAYRKNEVDMWDRTRGMGTKAESIDKTTHGPLTPAPT